MIAPASNGTLLAHARRCAEGGVCVLPAIARDKRPALPAWKPYRERAPSREDLEAWFTPPLARTDAMCLVCGSVSGGLEVMDFDLKGAAYPEWRRLVGQIEPGLLDRLVIEQSPSGGCHVVYRREGPVPGSMRLAHRVVEAQGGEATEAILIETRGEGAVCLCAPSPGYELLQGDLAKPPRISEHERGVLHGCARMLDEARRSVVDGPAGDSSHTPARSGTRPGDEYNERGDLREVLCKHDWKLIRRGENEHWCRPGKERGTSATLKGGVFYVFSSNAPPFEPTKGYAPFAVYALLEHGGDYRAAASALARQGYGEQASGVDHSAGTAGASQPIAGSRVPAPVSVGELVAAHPRLRPPVIDGLLRRGETMNIIAPPKAGKSWLSLDLAIAVAAGRPWLGRYATTAGPVLILDNELHPQTSAHRIPRVAAARGVDMSEIAKRVFVDNLRGGLLSIDDLGPYFDALEPDLYRLIVLDAFYRFMPAGHDENDNGTMASIYNRLDAIANRLGSCFVLIHHSSKGSQSNKSVTDVGAGAGAQSRATDTHLVLRPHEEDDVVVLDAAVRSWPPVEPACLRWEFPVWTVDEELDPAKLKNERVSKKKDRDKPKDDVPKLDPWTLERFVEVFISDEPISLAELRERASSEPELTIRRADNLKSIAEGRGLIERVRLPGRGGRWGYTLPPKGCSK